MIEREFGRMPDGREVREYTLDNGSGMTLSAINFGGIVTGIRVPDRHGRVANVVLGFATLAEYLAHNPNCGTIVGRYANRIAAGRFTLDGTVHELELNDGPNSLHGGMQGFGKRWWNITPLPPGGDGSVALQLDYTSEDGEGGYPGRLQASVRYTLMPGHEWRVDYQASTDRATVVNLSHHDYFNLAGSGSALDQRLTLAASRYTAIDRTLIPVSVEPVEGTPFDFRAPARISQRIRQDHPQLALARGYDHNWLLDRPGGAGLSWAARLEDEGSGRTLELHTTEPAMQFYSGNFLDGRLLGAGGALYRQGDGICLEPQHSPDSPNHPEFPSTVLRPGESYHSTTVYRFSAV